MGQAKEKIRNQKDLDGKAKDYMGKTRYFTSEVSDPVNNIVKQEEDEDRNSTDDIDNETTTDDNDNEAMKEVSIKKEENELTNTAIKQETIDEDNGQQIKIEGGIHVKEEPTHS